MATERRHLTDKQSMEAIIEGMPQRDRIDFLSMKWLSMEPAFPGRKMVVYTLRDGRPQDIEVISFGEIAVGIKEEPTVRIIYRNTDQLLTVTPQRLAKREIFLSIPQNFIFRWAGQEINGGLEFRAQYAVLIKSRSRDALSIEGHTYCLTLKRFLEAYPKLADEVRF